MRIACLLAPALFLGLTACAPDQGTPPPDPEDTAGSQDPGLPRAEPIAWQCGERRLEAVFEGASVQLDLPERRLRLAQAESASGARYAGEGIVFWTKGSDQALLERDGEQVECQRVEGRSPWAEARERGIGFRAVGNEPGWAAEVAMGEAPAMRLQLDYGQRVLDFPLALPLTEENGGPGFRGEVGGTVGELRIRRGECIDGMSGERFGASAEVFVDGTRYAAGCGHYLFEFE